MGNAMMKRKAASGPAITTTGPVVMGPRELGDPWGVASAKVTRSTKPLVITPDQIGPMMGQLLPLCQGQLLSAAINTCCRLSVPDVLGSETLTVRQIAARIQDCPGLDEHKLWRVLRIMGGVGLLKETAGPAGEPCYALTPMSAMLQTGLPQPSVAAGVKHWNEKAMWDALLFLPAAVTGKLGSTTPEVAAIGTGGNIWAHYNANQENMANFAEFMTVISAPELGIVTETLTAHWGTLKGKTVVDIGGSEGTVAGALKAADGGVRAVSFDLPEVVDQAKADRKVPAGVEMVGGSFFEASQLPKDADAYFMKHILHDWGDEDSLKVLKAIHTASKAGAELVLAEAVIPDPGVEDPVGTPAKFIDAVMLCIGGVERSRSEWVVLLSKAGWKLDKVVPTMGPNCQMIFCTKA